MNKLFKKYHTLEKTKFHTVKINKFVVYCPYISYLLTDCNEIKVEGNKMYSNNV